jgi:hypothetical protein
VRWPADEDGKRWCIGPCERLLPLDDAHFGTNVTGRTASGARVRTRRRTCRECWRFKKRQETKTARGKAARRAQTRRYYERHGEAVRARVRRYWHTVRKVA